MHLVPGGGQVSIGAEVILAGGAAAPAGAELAAALVKYVATRYIREQGYAGKRGSWITTLAVMQIAVARANWQDYSTWTGRPVG